MQPARVYHLATVGELRSHRSDGVYVPPSLARDGFIHCTSAPATVLEVARDYFGATAEPLAILEIDPARLGAPLRFEAPAPTPACRAAEPAEAPGCAGLSGASGAGRRAEGRPGS